MANCICGRSLDQFAINTRAGCIQATDLADNAVTPAKVSAAIAKVTLKAGGAAGDHTVTGMAVGDELAIVLHISTAASVATIADLTSEFTVAAAKVTNVGGTDTTNDQLLIIWNDLT